MPDTLSLRGYGTVRSIDLAKGVRAFVPPQPTISLRALMTGLLPAKPVLAFAYNYFIQVDALNWQQDATITGFQLQRATDGQNWTLVADNFGPDALHGVAYTVNGYTYHDSNESFELTHWFRLRVRNAIGWSGWSKIAHAPPPPPPSIDHFYHKSVRGLTGDNVNFGETITLYWKVNNLRGPGESVVIVDQDYDTKQELQRTNVTSDGQASRTPSRSKMTYRLIASGSNGSADVADGPVWVFNAPANPSGGGSTDKLYWVRLSNYAALVTCAIVGNITAKDKDEAVAKAKAQGYGDQNGVPWEGEAFENPQMLPTCDTTRFWFRLLNAQNVNTPCITYEVDAISEMLAKQIAEYHNQGYKVDKTSTVSEAEVACN